MRVIINDRDLTDSGEETLEEGICLRVVWIRVLGLDRPNPDRQKKHQEGI